MLAAKNVSFIHFVTPVSSSVSARMSRRKHLGCGLYSTSVFLLTKLTFAPVVSTTLWLDSGENRDFYFDKLQTNYGNYYSIV